MQAQSSRPDDRFVARSFESFSPKEKMMKTRIATLLAVVTFAAVGLLAGMHTDAKTAQARQAAAKLSPQPAAPSSAAAVASSPNFANNHGRITRIYPEPTGVYFTFGGQPGQWQTAMNPTNGYYYIPLTHPNYASLVNLLYLAAEHDWNLQARTQPTLGTGGRADVIYLVQDFAR